jgi:hypothetical protein
VPPVGIGVDDVLADDADQVLIGIVGGGPISQSQVGSFTDFLDITTSFIQIIDSSLVFPFPEPDEQRPSQFNGLTGGESLLS